ncbi:hypothetical protein HK096_003484 [Nowakowskiella sp. JEL0078]|nr:hypothetical protein HK096_003484 [Nowakowskiella sp. JEL0078]
MKTNPQKQQTEAGSDFLRKKKLIPAASKIRVKGSRKVSLEKERISKISANSALKTNEKSDVTVKTINQIPVVSVRDVVKIENDQSTIASTPKLRPTHEKPIKCVSSDNQKDPFAEFGGREKFVSSLKTIYRVLGKSNDVDSNSFLGQIPSAEKNNFSNYSESEARTYRSRNFGKVDPYIAGGGSFLDPNPIDNKGGFLSSFPSAKNYGNADPDDIIAAIRKKWGDSRITCTEQSNRNNNSKFKSNIRREKYNVDEMIRNRVGPVSDIVRSEYVVDRTKISKINLVHDLDKPMVEFRNLSEQGPQISSRYVVAVSANQAFSYLNQEKIYNSASKSEICKEKPSRSSLVLINEVPQSLPSDAQFSSTLDSNKSQPIKLNRKESWDPFETPSDIQSESIMKKSELRDSNTASLKLKQFESWDPFGNIEEYHNVKTQTTNSPSKVTFTDIDEGEPRSITNSSLKSQPPTLTFDYSINKSLLMRNIPIENLETSVCDFSEYPYNVVSKMVEDAKKANASAIISPANIAKYKSPKNVKSYDTRLKELMDMSRSSSPNKEISHYLRRPSSLTKTDESGGYSSFFEKQLKSPVNTNHEKIFNETYQITIRNVQEDIERVKLNFSERYNNPNKPNKDSYQNIEPIKQNVSRESKDNINVKNIDVSATNSIEIRSPIDLEKIPTKFIEDIAKEANAKLKSSILSESIRSNGNLCSEITKPIYDLSINYAGIANDSDKKEVKQLEKPLVFSNIKQSIPIVGLITSTSVSPDEKLKSTYSPIVVPAAKIQNIAVKLKEIQQVESPLSLIDLNSETRLQKKKIQDSLLNKNSLSPMKLGSKNLQKSNSNLTISENRSPDMLIFTEKDSKYSVFSQNEIQSNSDTISESIKEKVQLSIVKNTPANNKYSEHCKNSNSEFSITSPTLLANNNSSKIRQEEPLTHPKYPIDIKKHQTSLTKFKEDQNQNKAENSIPAVSKIFTLVESKNHLITSQAPNTKTSPPLKSNMTETETPVSSLQKPQTIIMIKPAHVFPNNQLDGNGNDNARNVNLKSQAEIIESSNLTSVKFSPERNTSKTPALISPILKTNSTKSALNPNYIYKNINKSDGQQVSSMSKKSACQQYNNTNSSPNSQTYVQLGWGSAMPTSTQISSHINQAPYNGDNFDIHLSIKPEKNFVSQSESPKQHYDAPKLDFTTQKNSPNTNPCKPYMDINSTEIPTRPSQTKFAKFPASLSTNYDFEDFEIEDTPSFNQILSMTKNTGTTYTTVSPYQSQDALQSELNGLDGCKSLFSSLASFPSESANWRESFENDSEFKIVADEEEDEIDDWDSNDHVIKSLKGRLIEVKDQLRYLPC